MVRFELGGWKFGAWVVPQYQRGSSLGLMLQRYLVASYGYYILGVSVMDDCEYDQLARTLLERWDDFEHMHKHLVTRGDLEAGTLYRLSEDKYPGMVKGACTHLIYKLGIRTCS